jgi:hypothetical protein
VCTDVGAVADVRAHVDGQCPCAGATHHRAYVRCAVAVARAAVTAGRLPKACKATVKHCAAKSTCGRPGFVSCCRTTAEGVQKCAVKPTAGACKAPKGGTACVGDLPSCCDACGGETCPAPTTTSTTTILGTTTPGGSSSTTTTSPPVLQCLVDADCPAATACDGLPRCIAGVCVAGAPSSCADGTPALWIGTASSFFGFADIELTICAVDGFISGTFACWSDFLPCFGAESPLSGATIVGGDGVTILFGPVIFGTGDTCTFQGLLVGPTMGGGFVCVDPFGFIVTAGTWNASRCP